MLPGGTLRVRATLNTGTNIATLRFTVLLHTLGHLRAVTVPLAFGRTLAAALVRIPHQPGRARAPVRASAVATLGVRCARSLLAEVDQRAAPLRVAGEARLTVAHLAVVFGRTERIGAAGRLTRQAGDLACVVLAHLVRGAVVIALALHLAADAARIPVEALLALALRHMVACAAVGIAAAQDAPTVARIATLRPSVRVRNAHLVRAAIVVRPAFELLRADAVVAVLEVRTGGVGATGRLAHALYAQLIVQTVAVGAAQRAAHPSATLRAGRALRVVVAVLQRHTSQQRIASRARLTGAHGQMVFRHAVRTAAARTLERARIDAAIANARSIRRTLVRRGTLEPLAGYLGIAPGRWGTLTLGPLADHRAQCVLAAHIRLGTRVLAMGVHTHCTARAVFARQTFIGPLAAGSHRVAHQSGRTGAQIIARQILAQCRFVAWARGFARALVDVFTLAVGERVALVANAHRLMVLDLARSPATVELLAGVDAAVRLLAAGPLHSAVLVVHALHLEAADAADLPVRRIAKVSRRTEAFRPVAHHLALRIPAALLRAARAAAFASDAGQLVRTVDIPATLARLAAARTGVSVPNRSLGTLAAIGAGNVLTYRARMARPLGTLINIGASERRPDEALHALALARLANALRWAVGVGSASWHAHTRLAAYLAGQTVVVGVANLRTNAVSAPLSNRTGWRRLGTGQTAQIADAHVARGTLCRSFAARRHPHAALVGRWIALEPCRAGALGHVIYRRAERVRSARIPVRRARVGTLEVNAGRRSAAVAAAAAPDRTDATGARLPLAALAVIGTGQGTNVAKTALARRAVVGVAARNCTLATVTHVSVAVEIAHTATARSDTTVSCRSRRAGDVLRLAATHRLPIDDRALRVDAARTQTRIGTLPVHAGRTVRTVAISPGTGPFLSASRQRVSDLSYRTLAHVPIRARLAGSGRMARVRIARSHLRTFDLGNRVRPIARRTLAHGAVVFRDAHRILATRILLTDVHAAVRHAIAKLVRGAVPVVDARHRLASLR